MAEIKNSFLRSKMNKDLDDRLIPNGEYRDAQNISVGKSEDDDIGALENILGNVLTLNTDIGVANLKLIGYFTDNNNDIIYTFLTNDTSHYIYKWSNGVYTLLVTGSFLNFNKLSPIIGINLVENLLFWTDDRNQPRKINIDNANRNDLAVPIYYTKENQISVAKYNPYEPLELLKSTTSIASLTSAGTTITLSAQNTAIKKGMNIIGPSITADNYIYVVDFSAAAPFTITTNVSATVTNLDVLTFLTTTMTGKDISFDFNNGNDWPGDPDFLQDLFVRFSYRYKFDDQEYSIMAPFTQPAFIPQQKGYFFDGDEDAAYRSTILSFMENGVQNVELIIPLPDKQNKIGTADNDTYKIIGIDILYKESDARAVKVLDSIDVTATSWSNLPINSYTYNYQSRKPFKTLPERQTVRVYDRVPVKAKAQEVSGNRVIYGNYQSQHTPPSTLNYNVGASAKNTTTFKNWAEYPNHTLKQNRNYQVGFVLSDKFGRQSSVILSSVDAGLSLAGNFFGGSTFYHPYKATTQNLNQWFGDALKVVVNQSIASSVAVDGAGAPGLYANVIGTGFNTTGVTTNINGNTFTFTLSTGQVNVPTVGSYLRGEYTDFVEVTNVTNVASAYTITTDGEINGLLYNSNTNNPDVKFGYTLPNPLGWYSYKVVVKQQEQEYYNVYLPGFLNGYPSTTGVTDPPVFPTDEDNKTANVVLLNDNINKIPRDLNETSDQQKQFRSSVQLYGRVNNNTATSNIQFFPVNSAAAGSQFLPLSMTADTIATANDLSMGTLDITVPTPPAVVPLYQLETNPFIARLATSNAGTTIIGTTKATMKPFLSIVETEPVDSLLQLFYETTTAGLIADLNADIDTGFDGVSQLSALGYFQTEGMAANTDVTGVFYPQNNQGSNFANTQMAQVAITVVDGAGVTRATGNITYNGVTFTENVGAGSQFKIKTSGTGYRIETLVNTFNYSAAGYNDGTGGTVDKSSKEKYSYTLVWTTVANSGGDTSTTPFTAELTNLDPTFIDGPSLPDVVVSAGTNVGVTRQGYNGSAINSNLGLRYSIVSQSPGSYFSIADSTTGVVTKTANAAPIGVYNLQLKVEDAILSNVPQLNTKSVTKSQKITIGAVPINASAKSPCTTVGVVSQGIPASFQSVVPNNTTSLNTRTAAWYLSDNTLTQSDFNMTGVSVSANTGDSNFVNKMGSALTQGTIVFQCNMQQLYSYGSALGGPNFATSDLDWIVYHRATASDPWAQINDVNNSNIAADAALLNSTINTTKYASTAFAFNQTGEYAVIAKDAYTEYAGAYSDSLCIWVNSNDLYYSTCVVENGTDVTDNKTPKSYLYQFSSSQSSYTCSTGNTNRYAPMPYSEYVDLFYLDAGLTSPSSGASYGYPTFFGFSTASSPSEPFNQIDSSAKFNLSGIKISGDAGTCSDKYARSCTGCARPVPGATGWT